MFVSKYAFAFRGHCDVENSFDTLGPLEMMSAFFS